LSRAGTGWLRGVAVLALSGAAVAACGDDDESTRPTPPAEHTWEECQGTDQEFVRRALLALVARRPSSQSEVLVYAELMEQLRALGSTEDEARSAVARAIMSEPAFNQRWSAFFKDALQIVRTPFVRTNTYDLVQTQTCYRQPSEYTGPALAEYVRDNSPSADTPPIVNFTMGQLVSSAIELDDVSPIYRAHLFHSLTTPLPGANVDPLELERARRNDFGTIFEDAYLNRDPGCLPCHNSDFSVTYFEDEEKNRAWPVPGSYERLVFGASAGPSDPLVARSVFRHDGVVGDGVDDGDAPWGWGADRCGTMNSPGSPDPLGINTSFAGVGSTDPNNPTGLFASVWTLELSLRTGFSSIAGDSSLGATDPSNAFAYLVAQTIAEKVWFEMVGSRLTIATRFPRTKAQRDVLMRLAESLVANNYSLKSLLTEIVIDPAFNLAAPEAGCGDSAYEIPRLFDPFTDAEADGSRRLNSPADGAHAIAPRPLRTMLHTAMEWPAFEEFPRDADEEAEHISLGFFVGPSQPGSRGFDLNGSLLWESLYGSCPTFGDEDFITRLVTRARQESGTTVGDAVVVLKDRLVGEPVVSEAERVPVEALLGSALGAPASDQLEAGLRRLCGALVSSPQFLLGGIVAPDSNVEGRLTAVEHARPAICTEVAQRLELAGAAFGVQCDGEMKVFRR